MKTFSSKFAVWTSYFFILLFCYAAISKVFDFENFQLQLSQSPLTNHYSAIISYAVIVIELVIVWMLSSPKLRILGLHGCFTLMFFFTVYIYIILNYSDNIPCSCGGILENLGWSEHMVFNVLCSAIALAAIVISTKARNIRLSAVILAEILIPSILLLFSIYPVIKENQDSFVRKVKNPFTSDIKIIDLPKSSHYFAGNHGDTVFLADSKTPLLLKTIDLGFEHVKTDTLKLDDYSLKFRSVRLNVLYPHFSVTDGKVPVIYEGELPSLYAYKTALEKLYFSKLIPIGHHQYVFRAVVTKTKKSELGIVNTLDDKYEIIPDVLESDFDGIFDTDGTVSADPENKKIFYAYLYRNKIISTDLNLSHIERFSTIDSFSDSDIKVQKLSNGQTKLEKTPQQVNTHHTVWGNRIYNISKIRGKDESFLDFSKKIVIDIYDVEKKTYLYSYNINNKNRSVVKGILRTKKYFYVLSSDHIARYAFK